MSAAGVTEREPGQKRGASASPTRTSWHCIAFAVLICLTITSCSKRATLSDQVRNLTFSTLTGQKISMATLGGPTLVNFWATDCAICIKEMPDMAELYSDYAHRGFELIAVAMPYDAPNLVLEMAEREQWPFPVALDITGEALSSFETVKGTPTSYLLDSQGKLIKRYVGAIPMDELHKQLDTLLGSG